MDKILSQTFDFLRFPLALLVVYLHIDYIPQITVLSYDWLSECFSPIYYLTIIIITSLARLAVPSFFIISGYLLFMKIDSISFKGYLGKIQKKIKTLVLPYIIWNILGAVYLFITQDIKIDTLHSLLIAPANFPLWFMRDLIIMNILYPIIYVLIKYLGILVPIIILGIYLSGLVSHISICLFSSITFFTIGAYLGHRKFSPKIIIDANLIKILLYSITSILFIITIITYGLNINEYFEHAFLITGSMSLFVITYGLLKNNTVKTIPLLANSSFFIYLSHKLGPTYLSKIIFRVLPSGYITMTIQYIFAPILACCICIFCYYILNQYFKRLTLFLTGR